MRIRLTLLLSATLTITANLLAQQSGPVVYVQAPPPQPQAPAPENSDKPVRVSGAVEAGNLITKVPLVYPDTDAQGSVVLHAIIAPDGSVRSLSVIAGPEPLQKAAMEAVRQWRYQPFVLNGKEVAVDTTVVVNFKR